MRTILRDIGLFLHVPGIMALISLPVCLLANETYALVPLLTCAFVSIAIGQLLFRQTKSKTSNRIPYVMATAALGWLLVPLFGSIPIWMTANAADLAPDLSTTILQFQNPWNCIFESFSGFTSTGLSMAFNYSELPHTLQWWRSFIEWVGGVGVIVLVISLLEPTTEPYQLYNAEGRSQRIGLTVGKTVRRIWWIYLAYTIGSIFLFRIVGMTWWEALNHSMTAISTGGFSVRDNSIGDYGIAVKLAVIVVMTLGAISFSVHYQFLRYRKLSAFWSDNQHQALWILLSIGTLLLSLMHYLANRDVAFIDTLFQWSSALGTCGFNTVSVKSWDEGAKLLMALAMAIGGAAGSTAGGIKLSRLVILFKAIVWRFRRIALLPHEMMRYKLDGKLLKEQEADRRVDAAAVLAILWLSISIIGVFVLQYLKLPTYNLVDVIFEVASATSGVGLSTGISHPDLPWLGKLTLIFLMWMGRLEIISVLLLFSLPIKSLANRK
ncbi:TrkH family potassium uptake protein [Pleurocapsa sp. FMAR1]|uniref:TrkH family potassium uptake protein n=1 Tax=Pleurocapsa sp. FMAR1 TaxID=3040204 RepID=UPI0029C7C81C|nr:TrkH family potassium uptake protein [Pleurocapsa sp. FMAR1]